MDKYFLGDVDEEKLEEGAIKGYIEGLDDPYTEYISKDNMKDYMEDTTGNFVGIGIYMVKDTDNNKVMVLSPIKGSPAEKAGILPGDLIISVDGVQYSADEMSVAANKIKGEAGTTVKIEILRGTETKEFELIRENIRINPVEGKIINNNIGYIEFSSFDQGTAKEFKNKYEEFQKQNIKSLIIDLRNNGGGIVDEALEIADYILDKDKVILYEVDKNNKEEFKKSENDPIINLPIVIITNKNTASSSEILAGALKDNGKAVIVGEKTYGKGVIQQLLTLPDGSGLKITSEEYLTTNKTKINKIGIDPDASVKLPETIKNVLKVEEKDDTQLQKVIEILNAKNN
ncbi:MAG: S41 family peptidase [Romboutsia sp.]|nr:S41 family peptidase [Romboutsia sp.]